MAVSPPPVSDLGRPAMVIAVEAGVVLLLLAGLGPVALALAILIPIAFALVERPQRGFLLLVALAPFNGLLLVVPHPGISAGWKEGLVLATLIASFLCPASARAPSGRRPPAWAPAIGLLALIGLVSATQVGLDQGLTGLKIDLFYVLVAATAWRCPLNGRERDRLVTILMVVGVLTALVGIAQEVVGPQRLNQLGYEYNSTIRFSGSFFRAFSTFNQPFPFGFFTMIVLLIGISAALAEPRRLRSIAFLACTPLLGLGLLFTFVRAAWLGLAVGVAYLGSHRYRLLLLALPLGLAGLLLLPRDISTPALSSSSSKQRAVGWRENATVITEHPLGAGIGASGAAAEKVLKLRGGLGTVYQPDNYYFKTVLELGPLGLWALLLLLLGTFTGSRASARHLTGRDSALASGVSAMVLAAAFASTVATYFEIFPMDLLFWALVGVVASTDASGDRTSSSGRRTDHLSPDMASAPAPRPG